MNSIMKKLLISILISILPLTSICGCAGKQAPQSTPTDNSLQDPVAQDSNQSTPEPAPVANKNDGKNPFKFTIDTSYSRDDLKVIIGVYSEDERFTVNYDLDCEGDGEYEYTGLTKMHTCSYKSYSGTHQVWVRGEIPAIRLCADHLDILDNWFSNGVSVSHSVAGKTLVSVDDWGDISWKKMRGFAANCNKLSTLPKDPPDLSQTEDMSYMFYDTKRFNQSIEHWDVSNIKNMEGVFKESIIFNKPIEKWNVSNVENMQNMFLNAEAFNQPLDNWNVSNVNNMYSMFSGASHFNQPLEHWNVSNVKDMEKMFNDATEFNQPLGNWNVSNVTNMQGMFQGASAFNQLVFNAPVFSYSVSKLSECI